MTWLGAICVAFAGIFMGRYALEQGWVGPVSRVLGGLGAGVAMHAAAEWLRRKTGTPDLSFAALAAGGTIALFATLMAALHWYHLINPGLVFALMTAVALLTLTQARIYGPLYALFGMLAAYIVPALVSTGSGQLYVALIYSLIITVAVLLLLNFVYRPWLWLGMVAGVMLWWLVSLGDSDYHLLRVLYLCAAAYLAVAISGRDLTIAPLHINNRQQLIKAFTLSSANNVASMSLGIVAVALSISFMVSGITGHGVALWLAPVLLYGWFSYRNDTAVPANWLIVLALLAVPLLQQLTADDNALSIVQLAADQAWQLGMVMAAICAITSFLNAAGVKGGYMIDWRTSIAAVPPVLALAVLYLVASTQLSSMQWLSLCVVAALCYSSLIRLGITKGWYESWRVWLTLAAHFCYSLAVFSLVSDQILTAALSVQLVSLAYMITRHNLARLGWLFKLLVALIIGRLTIGPWVWGFDTPALYNVAVCVMSLAFAVLALRQFNLGSPLRAWSQGAVLHLVMLTMFTLVRWALYGDAMYQAPSSPLERAIDCSLALALGIVYYQRSLVAQSAVRLYQLFAKLLAGVGVLLYLAAIMGMVNQDPALLALISETPIVNNLWLYFGLPAIMALLYAKYFDQQFRSAALVAAAGSAFVFVTVQIRHFWQGNLDLSLVMSNSELYSYSVVWLAIAVTAMLLANTRQLPKVYRAGLALLAVVVAKLFLVDMSQLEGIYRIASFLGLGLALLGIAYLDRRLKPAKPQ